MCGIAGIWKSGQKTVELTELQGLNQAMQHRGPDDQGVWLGGHVGLAHVRLSIIDTSASNHQPMLDHQERVALSFNGEIYNFEQLRQELNYPFQTTGDTEMILAAYLEWGWEGMLSKFNGMFAIALYDKGQDVLRIARDRLGEKPLYYSENDGTLVFGSEIRTVMAGRKRTSQLSPVGVKQYLGYQTVFAPHTLIDGIHSLPAGHSMVVSQSGIQVSRYWNGLSTEVDTSLTREECVSKARGLLLDSVQLRLRSDVPFGAFLSGGVDSSLLVGMMAESSSQPVDTFSIGFKEKQWDESEYAQVIANKYNTHHHKIILDPQDFLSSVDDALSAMDHASGDGLNTYVVSMHTRKAGIKMAISGLGGDELFGGYPVFERMAKWEKWQQWVPWKLTSMPPISWLVNRVKNGAHRDKLRSWIASDGSIPSMYAIDRQLWSARDSKQLYAHGSVPFSMDEYLSAIPWDRQDVYRNVSHAEMATYMNHILLRDSDQMSMANALELRVPFLDHRLVEFALRIPQSYKRGERVKSLLIDIGKPWLEEVNYNRPKRGFVFPWDQWMRGALRDFCHESLRYLQGQPGFMPHGIEDQWQLFLKHHPSVPWNRLWPLVTLGAWMKKNNVHG